MHLPNAENAVVEIAKLRDYCLSTSHPRGRHKVRVFAIALNITANEAELLREALLVAARTAEAKPAEMDEYGQRYVLDSSMEYLDKNAIIRSSWIIRRGEDFPRLTSCYILRGSHEKQSD